MNTFEEQINLAKLATLNKKHFAFIGSMLYKLSIKPSAEIDTIYLNGSESTIEINPNWFTELSAEHSASMLAHEVLHYTLQHDLRRGHKEPSAYQKACDEVVNNMLMDFGFKIPEYISVNRQFQNKSVEYVYKHVLSEIPDHQDLPEESSNDNSRERNNHIIQSNMADIASGGAGVSNLGNDLQALFEEITAGSIDWKLILMEHFNELSQGDVSYHDLDRRNLTLGLFEPVNESIDTVNKVAIALDVSGSLSKSQIKVFLKEIKAIAESLNPEIISVCTFNHKLVDVLEFKQGDDLSTVNIKISGGTDLLPVFKYYNKPENRPEFLIVFSDLEVDRFPDKPKYHTTWVCLDNKSATTPFGKLLHISSGDLDEK